MDIVALFYYAAVCGLLAYISPRAGNPPQRLALGALVGVLAAGLLPVLRAVVG